MPTRTFSKGCAPAAPTSAMSTPSAIAALQAISIFLVKLVDEAAVVELLYEGRVDEKLRLHRLRGGIRRRHFGQHSADPFDAGIGLGRGHAREIFVRLLGDGVVVQAEEFLDQIGRASCRERV